MKKDPWPQANGSFKYMYLSTKPSCNHNLYCTITQQTLFQYQPLRISRAASRQL